MLRNIYLSVLSYPISLVMNCLAIFLRPFMVYGYWDSSCGKFRRNTRISTSVVLTNKQKTTVGDGCWIGHHVILDGSNGLKIGEGVHIAGLSGIYSHSSHQSIRLCGRRYIEIPDSERVGYIRGSVEIGDYTFVGVGAQILPGVVVGRGCVIGAGTIVVKDIPDHSIVVGNPAKIIGSTIEKDRIFFREKSVQRDYYDKAIIEKERLGGRDVRG